MTSVSVTMYTRICLMVLMFGCVIGLLLHNDEDLLSAFQTLSQQVQTMFSKMASMESTISQLQSSKGSSSSGVNYVRWGRTTCPVNGTSLVYEGYAAGNLYSHTGGGSNYLCLPTDPQWDFYEDSVSSGSKLYGVEYEFGDNHNKGGSHYLGKNVRDEDAPCAVCSTQRSEILMIPARRECYPGWTKEYSGYLMSESRIYTSTDYVCVDKQAEVIPGGHADKDGGLFYLVEGICGSLTCPPYVNGRELTCVVCSR